MSLPTNDKGKGKKQTNTSKVGGQGSKFITKPGKAGGFAQKPKKTGGTRGS